MSGYVLLEAPVLSLFVSFCRRLLACHYLVKLQTPSRKCTSKYSFHTKDITECSSGAHSSIAPNLGAFHYVSISIDHFTVKVD